MKEKIKQYTSKHDKKIHFIAGAIISLLFWLLLKDSMVFYAPSLVSITSGFYKEFFDTWKPNGRFSWLDLLCTSFGGVITNLILILI